MNRRIKIITGILTSMMFLFFSCGEKEYLTMPFDPADEGLGTLYVLSSPNRTVVVDIEQEVTSFNLSINVWGAFPTSSVTIPVIIDVTTTLPEAAFTIVGGAVTVEAGKNVASLTIQLHRDEMPPGVIYYIDYRLGEPSDGDVYELLSSGRITTFNPGPLAPWVGNYTVAAVSYGNPGVWDEQWSVSTELDPDDPLNNILIKGVAGSSVPLVATIDVENGTITIVGGQNIGDVYGFGDVGVFLGDPDFNKYPDPLVGTVDSETGEMVIDNWLHQLITGAYEGYIWDVFECTFTKTTKSGTKSANKSFVPDNKRPIVSE